MSAVKGEYNYNSQEHLKFSGPRPQVSSSHNEFGYQHMQQSHAYPRAHGCLNQSSSLQHDMSQSLGNSQFSVAHNQGFQQQ